MLLKMQEQSVLLSCHPLLQPVSHLLSFSLWLQKGGGQAPNRGGLCATPPTLSTPVPEGSLLPLTCSLNACNLLIYSSTHSTKITKP